MLDKRSKLILVICLLVGIPLLVWRFIGIIEVLKIAGDNREQLPVRRLRITINPSQQQELFSQFQKFAEKHRFEIEISDYGTGGESYLIWMLRDNIKIMASHNRYDREIVSVGFYGQTRTTPVSEETLQTINDLLADLESFISKIPHVTITQE